MFKRSVRGQQDQNRVDKSSRLKKNGVATSGSFRDPKMSAARLQQSLTEQDGNLFNKYPARSHHQRSHSDRVRHNVAHGDYGYSAGDGTMHAPPSPPSPIVTLTVGNEGRLFAAHEDVLCQAPFFEAACRGTFFTDAQNRRIALPDEEPEVFSAVLEFLYKGDYYPRLVRSGSGRDSWELEHQHAEKKMQQQLQQVSPYATPPMEHGTPGHPSPRVSETGTASSANTAVALSDSVTVYLASIDAHILRDTVVYCAATRYGLDNLARLALRKQGLHSGIDVATILRSAQYAYAHTPDSDSRLRAHYLALIIRCRKTFKRSGTMQMEMERGGTKLFFDLFVAMSNHLDDVMEVGGVKSPRG